MIGDTIDLKGYIEHYGLRKKSLKSPNTWIDYILKLLRGFNFYYIKPDVRNLQDISIQPEFSERVSDFELKLN